MATSPSPTPLDLATRHLTSHATFADLLARESIPTLRADASACPRLEDRTAMLSLRRALAERGKGMAPPFGSYPTERQALAEAARRIYEVRP